MRAGETWKRKEKWRFNLSKIYSEEHLETQMGKVILMEVEYEIVKFKLIHPKAYIQDTWARKDFINEFEKVYE